MTSYADKGEQPDYGKFFGFDHIHWWVGNAKMVASWYAVRMGFEIVAYSGLETGNRDCATWVVQQGDIKFAFSSALSPTAEQKPVLGADMGAHMAQHGDGVKDVAFAVTDAKKLYDAAMAKGAESVREPQTLTDEHGSVVIATVKTYGDTVHTFVQRGEYSGPFLPGFVAKTVEDPLAGVTPSPKLGVIDHIVGNMPDQEMMPVVEWYEKILQFHRFWSVDDKQIHTEYSSLRSVVMADYDEVIKMPINEPAEGKRKSQIQEYVEHYGGKGVQHIALRTENILEAITHLRARGVQFLNVPSSYYDALGERMKAAGISTKEDIKAIQDLNILVDFDDQGYLLQLFTMPLQDRPTVFLEVIQREGCQGFGAGNFKSLFEAIEREQAKRGNLV